MNLEQARTNMVEQQIRTWEVLDQDVLDLLYAVPREDFVPQDCTMQAGNANQSFVTVTGNSNTTSINQQGNNNLSATNSQGNGNNITVGQTGNNNSSLVSAVNAGGAVTVNLLQQAVTQGQTFVVQQTCTNGAGCSVSVVQSR